MGLIQQGEKNRREKAGKKDESTAKKHRSKTESDAPVSTADSDDEPGQAQVVGPSEGGDEQSDDDQGPVAGATPGGDDGDSDQQGGDAEGPAAGDDGSQGGSPETSGEGEDSEAQAPGQMGSPAADSGGGPQGSIDLKQIPVSPGLRDEYQKLNMALYKVLYTNSNLAQGVLKGVIPSGPAKIKSVALTSCTLLGQLNKKLHFIQDTPQIVLPFLKDVVSHVIDLAEQVKQVQFTDQEAVAALGTALEMTLRTYGVHKKQMAALRQHIPQEMLQSHYDQYQKSHQYALGAIKKNEQDFMHQHLAGQEQGGGAQPQGAPQQGGNAAPQQGGPPQGGPPQQGGGGGMIAQAGAAQQQQQAPPGATESEADEAEAQPNKE